MDTQSSKVLQDSWPKIRRACALYALFDDDPEELAAQIAVMASTKSDGLETYLHPNFLKRRVVDARRVLMGRKESARRAAHMVSYSELPEPIDASEPYSEPEPDPALEAWLLENVDSGAALRSLTETWDALGTLPPTEAEKLAILRLTAAAWGPPTSTHTRGSLLLRMREISQALAEKTLAEG